MAYIKTLKDNELIGGTDHTDVYPVSTTQAIFSQKPDGTLPDGIKHQKLEDRLFDGEEDCRELHRKAEKLVAYIINDKAGQTLEVTGEPNVVTLTGYADIETYGDESAEAVPYNEMGIKTTEIDPRHSEFCFTINMSSASTNVPGDAVNDTQWQGTYTLPNIAGEYVARFDVTHNGIYKYAESAVNVNLRKFFGFSDSTPVDITALGTSHFSNSVACAVTIPANGTGFKKIYFAVPSGMNISRVVQPDALNAPLDIENLNNPLIIQRNVGGTNYSYKLYWSADLIDSSVSKRLTIS